jgi:CO/xanthine dehydrogenase FAD-binding subunit
VAQRLRTLEQKLLGQRAASGLSALAEAQDLQVLSPIDDVRGSAAYRRDAALTLVRRAIEEALHE